MNPNTHEKFLKGLGILAGLFMSMVFLGGCSGVYDFTTVFGFIVLSLVGFAVVSLGFVYLTPMRCARPGCMGQMKPGWMPEYERCKWIWKLFYVCDTCQAIHKSSFSISIGIGDPY